MIEDGEVGVEKAFGTIADEPVGQGLSFQIPVARHLWFYVATEANTPLFRTARDLR